MSCVADPSNKGVEGADLVIEAIIENLKIKQELFDFLDKNTKPEAILASNTSSLLISDIVEHLPAKRQGVCCGLHYFNPVPAMRLVEVIRTEKTTDETIKIAYDVNKKMGKSSVLAKDKPGFIVNRLLAAYNREAFKMVERGDATVEDVDTAMKLGAGYREAAMGHADSSDGPVRARRLRRPGPQPSRSQGLGRVRQARPGARLPRGRVQARALDGRPGADGPQVWARLLRGEWPAGGADGQYKDGKKVKKGN